MSCFVQVNAKAQFGLTPLHLACQRGNLDAVTTLLKCENIDVNIQDEYMDTPLHEACMNGHQEIVKKLLAHISCSDIRAFNPQNSEFKTPFHFACHEGQAEVVQLLLAHVHDNYQMISLLLTTLDNERNTALHLACESGDEKIVAMLVREGANLLALKLGDVSPIHIAARHGFTEIANELIKSEEDILNVIDCEQKTPLHYSAAQNQVKMIQFLLEQ